MPNSGPSKPVFVPLTADHLPLLARWLDEPHMRQWWGEPEEELRLIRDMVEGRDSTRPFIIEVDGEPVGYIQYWHIGDYQNAGWIADHPWLAELPPETVGVDLSIGDPALLSRGIGSAALAAFARMLVGQGHRVVIIDPDETNARAIRAYTKAGFRPLARLQGRSGSELIMQYDPDADDST